MSSAAGSHTVHTACTRDGKVFSHACTLLDGGPEIFQAQASITHTYSRYPVATLPARLMSDQQGRWEMEAGGRRQAAWCACERMAMVMIIMAKVALTGVDEFFACCGVKRHAVLKRLGLLADPQMHHVEALVRRVWGKVGVWIQETTLYGVWYVRARETYGSH